MNENSDDVVMYIQVEVDEEEEEEEIEEKDSKKIYIEWRSSSEEISVYPDKLTPSCEAISKTEVTQDCSSFEYLNKQEKQDTKHLNKNDVESCKSYNSCFEEKCNDHKTKKEISQTPKADKGTELHSDFSIRIQKQMEVVFVKEPKKKFVTFQDEYNDFKHEKEVLGILTEEETTGLIKIWGKSTTVKFFFEEFKADICVAPNQFCPITLFDLRKQEDFVLMFVQKESPELQRALNLIHEIENNVVGVKLSDAILILPNLESELRKHLQQKMKEMSERELSVDNSIEDFFSTADFWPEDEEDDESKVSDASEERLYHLFTLLSNLEDAVKTNETSTDRIELCDYSSSKIYQLLHELTKSIKDLENGANMTNLAETLNIASQLDTAVREYDGIIRTQAENSAKPKINQGIKNNFSCKAISIKDQMKNLRKNVFQTVKKEAIKTEGRIERDFDRIDRLERENEEAMKFVEAFIEKMTRRVSTT